MSRIVFYSCSIELHAPWRRVRWSGQLLTSNISRATRPQKIPRPLQGVSTKLYAWKREKKFLGIFFTVAQMQRLRANWLI